MTDQKRQTETRISDTDSPKTADNKHRCRIPDQRYRVTEVHMRLQSPKLLSGMHAARTEQILDEQVIP